MEDLSRNRLHAAFESYGWTVEDLAKDYGEDLLVRIFDRGIATPYSFFVQAKATDRIAAYIRQDMVAFPIETGHLRHWVRFSEPVITDTLGQQVRCHILGLRSGRGQTGGNVRVHL